MLGDHSAREDSTLNYGESSKVKHYGGSCQISKVSQQLVDQLKK